KATAYLFLPPLMVAIFLAVRDLPVKARARGILIVSVLAIAINAPQYWRNFDLSGSPLGYDSAQGDGFFRWRNETFGWKQLTSNLLRHVSEQLGARSDRWNQGVYRTVLSLHAGLGIDPDDPATTWRWTKYEA